MLLGNYSVLLKSPSKFIGGSTVSDNRANFNASGRQRGVFSHASWNPTAAIPNGYEPPYSWNIAIKGGGLSAYNTVYTSLDSTGACAMGINLSAECTTACETSAPGPTLLIQLAADLSAAFGLSISPNFVANMSAIASASADTTGTLVGLVNLAASLSAQGDTAGALSAVASLSAELSASGDTTGTIQLTAALAAELVASADTTGTIQAVAQLSANLAMSGDVESSLGAIAWCVAELTASAGCEGDLKGIAHMSAELTTAGDTLTPGQIASAVWSALVTTYQQTGSFGEAISQGSAGLTAQQIRDAMALAGTDTPAAGSIEKLLIELHRIMGLDPTKPLIVTSTARTAGAEIEQSISEAPAGTVTVTRQ